MKVMVFCPYYLPGYKSGGPVRSVSHMVSRLGDEIDFYVVTHAHDYSDRKLYPNVRLGEWTKVGKANVLYLRDWRLTPPMLVRQIAKLKPDAIYLNSFFHPQMTLGVLLLRRLGLTPKIPFIIAPRGEFSRGALGIRRFKKMAFMWFARQIGLYSRLLWQASSEYEKQDIMAGLGYKVLAIVMHVAPDLTEIEHTLVNVPKLSDKEVGTLRLVFVGRISPMKNLEFALDRLMNLRGQVSFDIYGPVDKTPYGTACREKALKMPSNVSVTFHGPVPHEVALSTFSQHDFFLLPTHGENFGHVILESLVSGCPVLISDRTPWRDLAREGIGWDIPLEEPARFEEALQKAIDMDHAAWLDMSERAKAYAYRVTSDKDVLEASRKLFLDAEPILRGNVQPTLPPREEASGEDRIEGQGQ